MREGNNPQGGSTVRAWGLQVVAPKYWMNIPNSVFLEQTSSPHFKICGLFYRESKKKIKGQVKISIVKNFSQNFTKFHELYFPVFEFLDFW